MQNVRLIILLIVFAVAMTFLFVGAFGTEHKIYTLYGETGPGYTGSDPARIREFSFA